MDFSANGVYNMSFMVEQSVKAGKPMIGVSVDCESTLSTFSTNTSS